MKQLDMSEIINRMTTNINISSAIWEYIFRGEPNVEQNVNYLVMNVLTERNTEANKKTRVEFRLNWHNQHTTFKQLMDIRKIIVDEMVKQTEFGTFNSYWVVEENSLYNWIWEKNRKYVIFDLSFYFCN